MLRVVGDKEVIERLRALGQQFPAVVEKSLKEAGQVVRRGAMANIAKDGGPVKASQLTSRSGDLRDSIKVYPDPAQMRTRIGVARNDPAHFHAKIHEFGGVIRPKTKKALKFFMPDEGAMSEFKGRVNKKSGMLSVSYVNPKVSKLIEGKRGHWVVVQKVTMPKRPYLYPALESSRERIQQTFERMFKKLLSGGKP